MIVLSARRDQIISAKFGEDNNYCHTALGDCRADLIFCYVQDDVQCHVYRTYLQEYKAKLRPNFGGQLIDQIMTSNKYRLP